MKVYCSVAISLILSASVWGQAGPSSVADPQTSQAALQASAQTRPVSAADAAANRPQLNRQLALQLQQMRDKLNEMKTNDASIKDPAVRKHLQFDAELWDLMFSHINEVDMALMQTRAASASLSPTAQMYRRRMLQERAAPVPAAVPTPGQPVPAQSPAPAQTPAPSHP